MLLAIAVALLAASEPVADARHENERARQPRVVYVAETQSCGSPFERLLCDGFVRALERTGVAGRLVTPTVRENLVDTLTLVAKQGYDLVIVFGFGYREAVGVVARRQPSARFAMMDASRDEVPGRPRNVQGVVFRSSEAAYLAGWLAGRVEQERPGRDVVGVVAGVKILSVDDFVIGFRAGVRRASPRIKVLTSYSQDFLDRKRCESIARRQIARGAGVLFNVAGVCGLGTLEAAQERGVWGVGVDTDQSFLGPHILTSVVKRYDVGFLTLLRQVKLGKLTPGRDTVLTLRANAVGLGKISPKVPAPLRAKLGRLERRIASGEIRVPGAFPIPR